MRSSSSGAKPLMSGLRLPYLWDSVPAPALPALLEMVLVRWLITEWDTLSQQLQGESSPFSDECKKRLYQTRRELKAAALGFGVKSEKNLMRLLDGLCKMLDDIRDNRLVSQGAAAQETSGNHLLSSPLGDCLDAAAYLRGEACDFEKALRDQLLADPAVLLFILFLGDVRATLGKHGEEISGYELVLLYDDIGMRENMAGEETSRDFPAIAELMDHTSILPALKVAKFRSLIGAEIRKEAAARAAAEYARTGAHTKDPVFGTHELTLLHLDPENRILRDSIRQSAAKAGKKPDPNRMPLRKYMYFMDLLAALGICRHEKIGGKGHSVVGLAPDMLENPVVYSNLARCLDSEQRREAARRLHCKLNCPLSRENLIVCFLSMANPGEAYQNGPQANYRPIFMREDSGKAMFASRKGIFPEMLLEGFLRLFGVSVRAHGNMALVGSGGDRPPGFHPAPSGRVDAEALFRNADGQKWQVLADISSVRHQVGDYCGRFLPNIVKLARKDRIPGQKTFVLAASYGIAMPSDTPLKKMFPRVDGTSPEMSLVDLANDAEDITLLPITFETLGLMLQLSEHYDHDEDKLVNLLAEAPADVVYPFLSAVEKDIARTGKKQLRTQEWERHMKALFLHHFSMFRAFQLEREKALRKIQGGKS